MDKLKVKFLKQYAKNQHEYKEVDDKTVDRVTKISTREVSANPTLSQKAEKQKPPIERVLEDCSYKINDLIYFGTELVSNIKVANEKREITRRNYEACRKESELDIFIYNHKNCIILYRKIEVGEIEISEHI